MHDPLRLDEPVTPAGLRRVLEWLGTLDAGAGDDAGRIDLLSALEAVKRAAAAAQHRLTEAFRQSQVASAPVGQRVEVTSRSIAQQVASARGESPHRGGGLVHEARTLVGDMPGLLGMMAAGELSEYRGQVAVRETEVLSSPQRREVDAHLAADPGASGWGNTRFEREVRAAGIRVDEESYVKRLAVAQTRRRVSLRPAADGMVWLSVLAPLAGGVSCWASLTRDAARLRAAGDERSRAQIMADLVVERLTGVSSATAVPVRVNLVVSDATLLGGAAEPGWVEHYGPVPGAVARRLTTASEAERTQLRRLYADPAGRLVAMESRSRRFPAGLAAFVAMRDQVCRTPFCGAPVRHSDHVVPHAAGGQTAETNAQGLCEACNHARQAAGWRATVSDDGTVVTTTPTGHTYTSPVPSQPPPGQPATWPPPVRLRSGTFRHQAPGRRRRPRRRAARHHLARRLRR